MNLKELKEAYEAGTLTETDYMFLDNDSVTVYNDEGERVYNADPSDLLHEALNLLGIPWQQQLLEESNEEQIRRDGNGCGDRPPARGVRAPDQWGRQQQQ